MNINNIKQKLHKLSYILLTLPLAGGVGSGMLSSCTEWDDHYENGDGAAAGSNTSLWDEIISKPELSDFAEVLKAIDVTRQHKKTGTSYAEQLMGGRTYTLFAPVNGTFNKDSIIQAAQTNSGDSAVEKLYALNHLMSSAVSMGGTYDNKKLLLLNNKYVVLSGNTVNGIPVRESNIRCKNGVIHIMENPLPYSYTVYEALVNHPDFKEGAGKILQGYNVQEFDETSSVPKTSVDGKTVYADSVFYDINKMVNELARINDIDSTYYLSVPSVEGWNKIWNKVSKAFVYPETDPKRDSLQNHYTYRAIMDDAIFSMTTTNKNQKDSLVSVKYNPNSWNFDPRYHVFKDPKPFEEGGVMAGEDRIIECANGKIYSMPEWRFDPTQTYHKKLEIEGEDYGLYKIEPSPHLYSKTKLVTPTMTPRRVVGDNISKGGFLEIYNGSNWSVSYRLDNVLSAKYDVKVILLPLWINNTPGTPLPVKFKAALNYYGLDNKPAESLEVSKDFESDPNKVDTITLFENVEFPVCAYGQDSNVSLSLETTLGKSDGTKYSRRMFLDAIILVPKED